MSKLKILAIGGVGYVLGARAGRERYEQIKTRAQKFAQDPRVRSKAKDAGNLVKDGAPVVKDKVVDAAASAKATVKDKTSSTSEPSPVTGVDMSSDSAYPAN